VWNALRELFATNVRAIVRPVTTVSGESAMAYHRRGAAPPHEPVLASMAGAEERASIRADLGPDDRDELDRLFLGDS